MSRQGISGHEHHSYESEPIPEGWIEVAPANVQISSPNLVCGLLNPETQEWVNYPTASTAPEFRWFGGKAAIRPQG
jgi:hypothetical protein